MATLVVLMFAASLGRAREGDMWTCLHLPWSATVLGERGLVNVPARSLWLRLATPSWPVATAQKFPLAAAIG